MASFTAAARVRFLPTVTERFGKTELLELISMLNKPVVLENDAKKEGNMAIHVEVIANASRKHVLMDYAFLRVELEHQQISIQ